MKNILLIILTTLLFAGCNANQSEPAHNNNSDFTTSEEIANCVEDYIDVRAVEYQLAYELSPTEAIDMASDEARVYCEEKYE
jgi:uncharacterized protein YcfL